MEHKYGFTTEVITVYLAVFVIVAILLIIRQKLRTKGVALHSNHGKALGITATGNAEEQGWGIEIGNAQTIGRRTEQDDYFASTVTKVGTLAVLADGISGVAHGRMASTLSVTMFSREFLKLDDAADIRGFFHKAALMSNRSVIEQLGGAIGGTTLISAVVSNGQLYWGAVGDSLILLFRDGEFRYINAKDTFESVLESRYLAGEIGREDVSSNPMKNQLTNYLGYAGFKSMEMGEPIPLESGDIVVLCSDGVYDALTEVEMEQILMKGMPAQDTAEELIAGVERKSYKHQDNATVLILKY
ncbi:PP2C family protein-serine/threonine phosphatase [Paenibacillus senegalimassiliensis]|uniref:PP2C family protein-serine/threonine phosphatase n=1 Tax=Paenibacillus senegalimassiliensis TaxID=1737426 RepID=UPI00073E2087|nr:protein phosphatase 2C domain-containing protein [Paenibacillus senegalimassiliensis]